MSRALQSKASPAPTERAPAASHSTNSIDGRNDAGPVQRHGLCGAGSEHGHVRALRADLRARPPRDTPAELYRGEAGAAATVPRRADSGAGDKAEASSKEDAPKAEPDLYYAIPPPRPPAVDPARIKALEDRASKLERIIRAATEELGGLQKDIAGLRDN